MARAVFCTVQTTSKASSIVERLKDAGFMPNDISVLAPNKDSTKEFAIDNETKAPEGTAVGVSSGALLGGGLGWLAGIGVLAIPGVGPLIAAGPIMAALTGVAIGGSIGGVAGALIGLGIPEYEAKKYEGKIQKGNCLISVHAETSEQINKAKAIFEAASAEDISTSREPSEANRI